jgi:hypothetical protein
MVFVFSWIEYINVTAQYSNAVLLAVLPHFTDCARKLDLPVHTPITPQQVSHFMVTPRRGHIGGVATLTNGFVFGFEDGYMTGFIGTNAFRHLQDPRDIPRFYGPLNMTEDEVVALARQSLQKLGIKLEDVCAEYPPEIKQEQGIGTNIVPHFTLEWHTPRGDRFATFEINANRKIVEEIYLRGIVALQRPGPKLDVEPQPLKDGEHPALRNSKVGVVNPEYARQLVPYVFRAIEDWARKLHWNLPLPITTNHVERFYISNQGGWPHCQVYFTNGWEFTFRATNLTFAASPRCFFDSDRLPFRMTNYVGQWRLSEEQAIELARKEVAKLGHPAGFDHTEIKPRVTRPTEIKGWPTVPRLEIEWNYPDLERRSQWIRAEVDCDRGTVEMLQFDDISWWGQGPPIKVPISRWQGGKDLAKPENAVKRETVDLKETALPSVPSQRASWPWKRPKARQ